MTRKFHATNNAKWFAVAPPNGEPGSERMALYTTIAFCPGIPTHRLAELKLGKASVSSRLKELEDGGYIRSEKIADLFKEVE